MKTVLFLIGITILPLVSLAQVGKSIPRDFDLPQKPEPLSVRKSIDCNKAKATVKEFEALKATTNRFYADYDTLDNDTRLYLLQQGMEKAIKENAALTDAAFNHSDTSALVDQAEKLDLTLKMDGATRNQMAGPLKGGLVKLEDRMDDLVGQVQETHPDCKLVPKNSSQDDSSQSTSNR